MVPRLSEPHLSELLVIIILLKGHFLLYNLRDIGSLVYCSFVTASMTCYLLLFSVEGVSCFSNSTAVVETTGKLCIT